MKTIIMIVSAIVLSSCAMPKEQLYYDTAKSISKDSTMAIVTGKQIGRAHV